jgi:hypothetical protein
MVIIILVVIVVIVAADDVVCTRLCVETAIGCETASFVHKR